MTRDIKIAPISVEYIDHMGSDARVRNVAWTSFDRWGPEDIPLTDKEKGLLAYLATGLPAKEREDWERRAKAHAHWSPFAHCFLSVRVAVPIFLARQLVKHQVGLAWNEESRRYISSDVDLWLPEEVHCAPENAKQGASAEVHNSYVWKEAKHGGVDRSALDVIRLTTEGQVQVYYDLLDAGVAPEEARIVLPLNSMVHYVWSGSLMAFNRVYQQRIDGHAQTAAREFAGKLGVILYDKFPESMKALNDG
jgi:thymidylate synthase (FAD)